MDALRFREDGFASGRRAETALPDVAPPFKMENADSERGKPFTAMMPVARLFDVLEVVTRTRFNCFALRESSIRYGHDDRADKTEGRLEMRTDRDDGGSGSSKLILIHCLR